MKGSIDRFYSLMDDVAVVRALGPHFLQYEIGVLLFQQNDFLFIRMLKYGIALLLDGGPTTMVQQSDLINLNPDEPPKKKRTVHVFYTIFFFIGKRQKNRSS